MSNEADPKPGFSKKLRAIKVQDLGLDHDEAGTPEGSVDFIQDQLIIAPEIMSKILEELDLRSLKKVRLVCKSWIREAQVHMERRGIVRLGINLDWVRMDQLRAFENTLEKKVRALPQPFKSVDASLDSLQCLPHDSLLIVSQLSKLNLGPSLVITRLCSLSIPFYLSVSLITQSASSLEYLELLRTVQEPKYIMPPMDPEQSFPRLQHLNLTTAGYPTHTDRMNFATVTAWIVKGSRSLLDTFEFRGEDSGTNGFGLKVDISNVKTLILLNSNSNAADVAAPNPFFLSSPFRQLENVKMSGRPLLMLKDHPSMISSTATLKAVDLADVGVRILKDVCDFNFPVCPNVEKLELNAFPYWSPFVLRCFPSLQALKIQMSKVSDPNENWGDISPFPALKTLRMSDAHFLQRPYLSDPIKFFDNFPALERLNIDSSFFTHFCRLKMRVEPRRGQVLAGLKHLELSGYGFYPAPAQVADYSFLAALKGIETITMTSLNESITTIPIQDMPDLKVLRFPLQWYAFRHIREQMIELSEISRGVEKVIVTNCCSLSRGTNLLLKDLVENFFDSTPNAECGCKEWKTMNQAFGCH